MSAAEASGTWLHGAVVPEEQCWATADTTCSTEIDASATPLRNEGIPPAYVNGGAVSYVNTGRRLMDVGGNSTPANWGNTRMESAGR